MPLFKDKDQELALVRQENRLTRIEAMTNETRQLVLGGLGLMLTGSYLLVKMPVDSLTSRVDKEIKRTAELEGWRNLHEQQSKDRRLYERLNELEEWKEERQRELTTNDGVTIGRSQMWSIIAAIMVGAGSFVYAMVNLADKFLR